MNAIAGGHGTQVMHLKTALIAKPDALVAGHVVPIHSTWFCDNDRGQNSFDFFSIHSNSEFARPSCVLDTHGACEKLVTGRILDEKMKPVKGECHTESEFSLVIVA